MVDENAIVKGLHQVGFNSEFANFERKTKYHKELFKDVINISKKTKIKF